MATIAVGSLTAFLLENGWYRDEGEFPGPCGLTSASRYGTGDCQLPRRWSKRGYERPMCAQHAGRCERQAQHGADPTT